MCYDELVAEFATLDTNGDHALSRFEFDNVARLPRFLGMTAEDVAHLFNSVDVNHDGAITLKEFVTYMAKRKDHLPLPVQVKPQKQRLDENMERYGFELCTTDHGHKGVLGDGNCQFYSLSWGLHQTTARHAEIRAAVATYLRGVGRSDFEPFYAPTHPNQPPTFDGYLDAMAQECTWGDHLTLQAAANIFELNARVLTSDRFSDTGAPVLVVSPTGSRKEPIVIWLAFAAQHYSPIAPTSRTPKELLTQQ